MRICARHYTGTKGVYANIKPDYNTERLLTGIVWYTHPPFPTHSVPYTSHVTLICSKVAIDSATRIPFPRRSIKATLSGIELWDIDGKGAAVFIVESPLFKHVHNLFVQRGAKHEFPRYIPHVTIAMGLPVSDTRVLNWVDTANAYIASNRHTLVFNSIKVRDMNCQ